MMRIGRQTIEYHFGTIKARMSATHFLTRTIERVSIEMSFSVPCPPARNVRPCSPA